MENTKLKRRVIRKCWKSIKNIQKAHNMVMIQHSIMDVMLDVYGIRDAGMHKILARESNTVEEHTERYRQRNNALARDAQEILNILRVYIPKRMEATAMYQKMFR